MQQINLTFLLGLESSLGLDEINILINSYFYSSFNYQSGSFLCKVRKEHFAFSMMTTVFTPAETIKESGQVSMEVNGKNVSLYSENLKTLKTS